jgi:hypothetical protein
MRLSRVVGIALSAAVCSAVFAACGSGEETSVFDPNKDGGVDPFLIDGSFSNADGKLRDTIDPDAFWANDPPPRWCGPETGAPIPPTPGGTPDCPTDKNRQGCPCTTPGETAPCWPGLRVNRNLGICKDGTTTCQQRGEFDRIWGPCQGAVLPVPTAKKGKEACKCFSAGEWAIKNIKPCLYQINKNGQQYKYVVSTLKSTENCPTLDPNGPQPPPAPTEVFSSNTLKVDCQGHFKLFFTIKAGDPKNRQPTDCTIAKISTEGDYPVINQVTPFPDLPSWLNSNPACVADFENKGAYAELSVKGESWLCEAVDDGNGGEHVFQTITYCPLKCGDPQNASLPECVSCTNGATGQF